MPGTGKKMLMWLGLADAEEYDDYEPYDEAPAPPQVAARPQRQRGPRDRPSGIAGRQDAAP